MRLIHRGRVSTVLRCGARVRALLLDEDGGHLYVCTPRRVRALAVPTRAARRAACHQHLARVWSLAQAGRAELLDDTAVPPPPRPRAPRTAAAPNGAEGDDARRRAREEEACARGALRRLMRCPISGVLERTLAFAFG